MCTAYVTDGGSCSQYYQCGPSTGQETCTNGICSNVIDSGLGLISETIKIAIGVSVAVFVLCCVILPIGICFCMGVACFSGVRAANKGTNYSGQVMVQQQQQPVYVQQQQPPVYVQQYP